MKSDPLGGEAQTAEAVVNNDQGSGAIQAESIEPFIASEPQASTRMEPPGFQPACEAAVKAPPSEVPPAVWYLRPPDGAQYGPASDDLLKKWIREGRVVADTFVWRNGWSSWQQASNVASSLPHPLSSPPAIQFRDDSGDLVTLDTSSDPVQARMRITLNKRRRSTNWQLTTTVLLVFLSVVLFAILVWVLIRDVGIQV